MVDERIITSICKFGGYVFKPVTPQALRENNVFQVDVKFPGITPEDNDPLYILGFCANRVFKKYETDETLPSRLQPIDDFTVGFPYDSIMPMSFVSIYGSGAYTGMTRRPITGNVFPAQHWNADTTRVLEALIKVAGVQYRFEPFVDRKTVIRCLEQYSLMQCFPKPEQPVYEPIEKPQETPVEAPVEADQGNIHLSREEVLELLKNERECVIRADKCDRDCAKCPLVRDTKRLIAMYDAVIKYYSYHVTQNQKGKYVRMADGTRKWFTNEKAAELLKLPLQQRVV